MLYALTDISKFTEEDLQKSIPLLSEQRLQKVQRYRFFKDKRLSACAFLLLRYALQKESQIFEVPELEFGKFGKPFLKNTSKVHFNLSHTSGGIVCGISDAEIGVDIADKDPKNLDCVQSALHPEELKEVQHSSNPAATFARFWALKESFLKFTGTGIGTNLPEINYSHHPENQFLYRNQQMQVFDQKETVICSCSHHLEELKFLSPKDLLQIFQRN